jgi:hypothetical protein
VATRSSLAINGVPGHGRATDWLTKTIVGVGLVNWNRGLIWFEGTAAILGNGLGLGPGPAVGSIIVFFGVNGFQFRNKIPGDGVLQPHRELPVR